MHKLTVVEEVMKKVVCCFLLVQQCSALMQLHLLLTSVVSSK